MRIGQDDADRLALEILVQVLQHRQGAAGQRGVEAGITDIGQVNAVGRDMPLPAAPPRRQDRVTHPARLDGLRRQEPLPGLGQPGVVGHARPEACTARHACPWPAVTAVAGLTGPAQHQKCAPCLHSKRESAGTCLKMRPLPAAYPSLRGRQAAT